MNSSVLFFKIKRFFESINEFILIFFKGIGSFFKRIAYHPKTEQAGRKIKKAKNRVLHNFKENAENWKHRNLDDHGFSIEEEDS